MFGKGINQEIVFSHSSAEHSLPFLLQPFLPELFDAFFGCGWPRCAFASLR
jgi:hypothetical protein